MSPGLSLEGSSLLVVCVSIFAFSVIGCPTSLRMPERVVTQENFKVGYRPGQTAMAKSDQIFLIAQVMWFGLDFGAVGVVETVILVSVSKFEIQRQQVISISKCRVVRQDAIDGYLRIGVHKVSFTGW
jgi:hypothetical protein